MNSLFHKSIQPCDKYGTKHDCFACHEAWCADKQGVNAIALELDKLGVECSVWQSGGFVMVGRVPTNTGVILFNDEGASFYTQEQDANGDEGTEGILTFGIEDAQFKAKAIQQTLSKY